MAVLELKRPGAALSDDDRRQGLSYARLLEPTAPLTIVSNGAQTQVFQTYDGAEWKAESPDATAFEQLIRNATRIGAQDIQNAIATLLGPESGAARDILRMIAQAIALSHTDRVQRLVVLSAVAGRTAEERARVQARLRLLQEQGVEAITGVNQERWFTPEFIARHPEIVERRMRHLRDNHGPSYAAAYTVFSTSDLGDGLHAIRAPTLIATGEHDVGSNTRMARYMHAQIQGSRLEILPGLRHSILIEAPQLVARVVHGFLLEAM